MTDIDTYAPPNTANSGEASGWYYALNEAVVFDHPILASIGLPTALYRPSCSTRFATYAVRRGEFGDAWTARIARCEHGRLAWSGDPMVVAVVLAGSPNGPLDIDALHPDTAPFFPIPTEIP